MNRTPIEAAMRRAVLLAERGLGSTTPNPVVGCVVLGSDGSVVGEGWHERAGRPHAEVRALAEAGERARGGTAVVTLEPCAHAGRTGPCVEALISAGVSRVAVGVADPTLAAGGGAARLRDVGVEVIEGVEAQACEDVARHWLTFARTGRPHVTWKLAATLDGRTAAADGTSRWITGSQARADVHRLRARCDAVLVGSGTRRVDDPHLAVRGIEGVRQPLRVVIETSAALPLTARVLDESARTLVIVGSDASDYHLQRLRDAGIDVAIVPTSAKGVDLTAVLAELARRDVVDLLVEGGARLVGSLVAQGLLDEVVAYLAPVLLGAGHAALGPAGIATIDQALRLRPIDHTPFGPDIRITARTMASTKGDQ